MADTALVALGGRLPAGPCEGFEERCGKPGFEVPVETAYVDEKMNRLRVLCGDCERLCKAFWADMWAEVL
jgi:hypothetical protein